MEGTVSAPLPGEVVIPAPFDDTEAVFVRFVSLESQAVGDVLFNLFNASALASNELRDEHDFGAGFLLDDETGQLTVQFRGCASLLGARTVMGRPGPRSVARLDAFFSAVGREHRAIYRGGGVLPSHVHSQQTIALHATVRVTGVVAAHVMARGERGGHREAPVRLVLEPPDDADLVVEVIPR